MFHGGGSSNNNNQVCDWDICHDGLDKSKSRRKEDENSKCKRFDMANFGPDSKSIFYGEANGRLGNQLLG